MQKILDLISAEVMSAFDKAGYDATYGRVSVSNRPDLCEYQCNGALALAKQYKKAPIMIANEIAAVLSEGDTFSKVDAVTPGFLNLNLSNCFLTEYIQGMYREDKFGVEALENPKTIIVDYGGPNVAKPLHVGHLRPAIIGESIKRIARFVGHNVIGDIHLGDWGLPIGLIITELKLREPDLIYWDESYSGEYPEEPPFTIAELEEIYPTASAKSKKDEEYRSAAMEATYKLQTGVAGYRALWKHILKVSVTDLKKNYTKLDVEFDWWKGESDVHDIIPRMVEYMKKEGYAYISDGALVVDVKEETDTKEMPPCMILKSDGASLYNTTDLATIMYRMETVNPYRMIYVVDKRQNLYFEQVFRCARKTKLTNPDTDLLFLGFGTMNGKDGKPFKTRDGGVMRLEYLMREINDEMYNKIMEGHPTNEEEARKTAAIVGLSAIKYGDLSNQASKDYIFDIDRFTSFEGDTGPYILYTIVRIKSILSRFEEQGGNVSECNISQPQNDSEKNLMLEMTKFNAMIHSAYDESAPHKVCAYIYDLANALNHFYHETKILTEEDSSKKTSWIALLNLTKKVLETGIEVLGFEAPERM